MNVLAKRLGEMRKKRGLTQRKLAEKLGVSYGRISLYETGDRSPDPEMLKRLADFFGCSTDFLLGLTDDPTPASEKDKDIDIRELIRSKVKKARYKGHQLAEEDKEFFIRVLDAALDRLKATEGHQDK